MLGSADVGETLRVDGLRVDLASARAEVPILRDVSFAARPSRITGIVGETGSGKTMTARAIFGLLPKGSRLDGSIVYRGRQLEPGNASRAQLLGRRFTMVFQDARSSLHPTISIGRQLDWALRRAGTRGRQARRERAHELLGQVGLKGTLELVRCYPHQLSGGMCQRAALAIALAPGPDILVADEPTSALDATIQLQIANLFAATVREFALTMILITHDMRLVRYLCDDVVVIRSGEVVEAGAAATVLSAPKHPYTRLLLEASV